MVSSAECENWTSGLPENSDTRSQQYHPLHLLFFFIKFWKVAQNSLEHPFCDSSLLNANTHKIANSKYLCVDFLDLASLSPSVCQIADSPLGPVIMFLSFFSKQEFGLPMSED